MSEVKNELLEKQPKLSEDKTLIETNKQDTISHADFIEKQLELLTASVDDSLEILVDKLIASFQLATSLIAKQLQSIDKNHIASFFESLIKVFREIEISGEQYKVYLNTMSECSWFPYACSDADVKLLIEINNIATASRGKSKRRTIRVDKVVYSYYTEQEIKRIRYRWYNSNLEHHIKKMLCQAINAHLRGEYALTVTCLAPMWEFFIREKIEDKKRTADEYKNDVKNLFIENGFEEEYGDFYTKSIIEKCYGPDETVEGVPNRHGIAHCWYKKYPNKKTSINAILVTDFIIRLRSVKKWRKLIMEEKLKMHSVNKVDENVKKIGELFPNCVTERLGEDGKPEYAVDFDMLRQELSSVVVEGNEERYQFTWPDKRKSILLANSPISATLRPCREESVDFDNTKNLYIEGDNLDVLKLLQETYLGQIKMIYIDPPYNTGNDFVYEDDFAEDAGEYLANSGQFDEQGNRLVQNTESNGRFHTDWLNMIYPRLKLAKTLLSETGIIFVSIADGELNNLKSVLNEVFGATNFIAQINIVTGANQSGDGVLIQKNVEYCLVYAKSIVTAIINRVDKTDESWRNLNDAPSPLSTRLDMGYTIYYNKATEDMIPEKDYDKEKVYTNDESKVYKANEDLINKGYIPVRPGRRNGLLHRWRWGIETFLERKKDVKIFENNGKYVPKFLQSGFNAPKNIQNFSGGAPDLKKLFGDNTPFDYPKGLQLLKYLCSIGANENDYILDFFSGSATTAHAVMQLNAEDGGHRKFIMVQLPEKTDEKSEAYKAGYKNICEIGKERIRRAGKKIKEENPMTAQDLDIGFRVLKLDSSNMKDVALTPDSQDFDFTKLVDNIKADRTPEDLLFQIMLDLGIELSAPIREETICGKKVFYVAEELNNFLIACFDFDVTDEVITEIAKKKPYYFVTRNSSMASDSVATNFDQIFATYSPTTVRKVL